TRDRGAGGPLRRQCRRGCTRRGVRAASGRRVLHYRRGRRQRGRTARPATPGSATMNAAFVDELRKLGDIRLDEPLSRHVTFGVGGPADVYIAARSEDQLRGAYALAERYGVPVFIFGSGSKLLVGHRGIRG